MRLNGIKALADCMAKRPAARDLLLKACREEVRASKIRLGECASVVLLVGEIKDWLPMLQKDDVDKIVTLTEDCAKRVATFVEEPGEFR